MVKKSTLDIKPSNTLKNKKEVNITKNFTKKGILIKKNIINKKNHSIGNQKIIRENLAKRDTIGMPKKIIKGKQNNDQIFKNVKNAILKDIETNGNQFNHESQEKKPLNVDKNFINTGIPGFDDLFEQGIPKGSSVLVAGGAGSGKTIMTLQTLNYHASQGAKCLYMSFEESEEKLIKHMEDFGWKPRDLIKKKKLMVKRFNPFDITRGVDALLMKAKGELLIDLDPVIFPSGFKPAVIVVDSLTAIASAFTGKEDSYRIYIEQLFRFFEKIEATSFLITETKQIPTIFSSTGVEEFLADGVIVLYNFNRGNIRENAIEVLKLRGAKHLKKIVAMNVTDNGILVYPEQEVFSSVDN